MKTLTRKTLRAVLTPLLALAAVVLFILDNLNVNVNNVTAYTMKDMNVK